MWNLLIQVRWEGFGGGDTAAPGTSATTYIVVGSLFAGVILIALVARAISRKRKGKGAKKFKKGAFRKECGKIGLSDAQANLLIGLIRQNEVQNSFRLLENSGQLNNLLQKALAETEDTDAAPEKKEARKLMIYRIKQIIEKNSQGKKGTISSRTLRKGQQLVLIIERSRLASRVAANLKDAIQADAPVTASGKVVTVPRWTRLTVQFWRNEGEMYSFHTKVMSVKMLQGATYFLLQHSRNIQMTQQRRYRRRPVDRPAYFSPVAVVSTGKGRDKKQEAIVNSQSRALGTVIDLSSGGCGIRTNYPLKPGNLVKLRFEAQRKNSIIAYGKVKSVQKVRPAGGIMHIQFNNLTRRNLNKINEYVYDDLSV